MPAPCFETFREYLAQRPGFTDPSGVHHEFTRGMHGRKLDWQLDPKSPEFMLLGAFMALHIDATYDQKPDILLSVANGTNDLAIKTAEGLSALGHRTIPLVTKKLPTGAVELTDFTKIQLSQRESGLLVILDDAATTGSTTASVAEQVISATTRTPYKTTAMEIEALYIEQRFPDLPCLDDLGIAYRAIFKSDLPTITPEG